MSVETALTPSAGPSTTSGLRVLAAARADVFQTWATAWLDAGARGVALLDREGVVASWPAETAFDAADLIAPIAAGGATLGELRVVGSVGEGATARLAADAALFGRLATVEDELAALTDELVSAQDQFLALCKLARSTRNHLDVETLLATLAREAASLLGSSAGVSWLGAAGEPLTVAQFPRPFLTAEELERVLQGVQPTDRALLLDGQNGAALLPEGASALLMAPTTLRGSYHAGVGVANRESGPFVSADARLLQAVAEQASAQMESVLGYQESLAQARLQSELELAARIQLRLLPRSVPTIAGLEVFARSQPALEVGGDFYDIIHKPGEQFVFVVGDVSGKGVSAALLMAMTRTVIRNKVNFLPIGTPESVVGRSNEDMYDDFTEVAMFATVFLGQYQPATRRLLYVNAGHSPVIYCPAGGGARMVEPTGTAIGVLQTSQFEHQTLTIAPGDLLIIGSDGLADAQSTSGEFYGYDRLLLDAERLAGRSATGIAEALFDAASAFSAGRPQDDDQTVIVLKGTPT